MDEYAEKAWAEPEKDRSAQIEKRLTELDMTIERLQHQGEMIAKRMQPVLRPAEPSDPSADMKAVPPNESDISERIGQASRRISNVCTGLIDLLDRCDL